jgi:putative spermidine/putrescine transport system substrate-binding protein
LSILPAFRPLLAPRRPLLSVGAGVVAVVLAACGDSTSGAGDGAASTAGDTITAYVGGDTNIKQLWESTLIPAFEKANPGYHVKLVYSAHGEADATTPAKLQAAAKTNNDPGYDIVESSITQDAAVGGLLVGVSATSVPNLAGVDQALLAPVAGAATPYRGSAVLLATTPPRWPGRRPPSPP